MNSMKGSFKMKIGDSKIQYFIEFVYANIKNI